MAGFSLFFRFFPAAKITAQVFDSVGLSRVFAGLSARAIDAYLFETKVEVVIQLCFQILRLSDELLIDPNSGALSRNRGSQNRDPGQLVPLHLSLLGALRSPLTSDG